MQLVLYIICHINFIFRLEDGTIAFLDIVSLKHGFNALDKLGHGMEQISLHTFSLAKDTYQRLSELKHYNGRPLCILYHDNCFNDSALQGPIVNFNLLTSSGTVIGFSEVFTGDTISHCTEYLNPQ